ncbi:4Fe-4S dicluster domain-containing protein [Corynebacterium uterequi]|uniref:Fe-S-cluster-containing hydrogenase subunit n=1 Tax=Corynebacterium uterequi TaxID=1072256 RepID=A0A0G3HB09_9CORY|nr:4Fe-4S dicluster domain-containing protein [Corynebacterium uterequi]AKK10566.1 Fe-S-cluster-containing hydrogenase subunit [Corynebacterium uterequi]
MSRLLESTAPGYRLDERKAFFTDTSICIGCKACEVACKEWNRVPQDGDYQMLGSSYDNTGDLGANTWRHVAFVEQSKDKIDAARESTKQLVGLGLPSVGAPTPPASTRTTPPDTPDFRWLMASDVCKHCTNAGCLDVCPTGALFRTEHGTVVVQDDVCNGCGTCVAGCPFGVIERRDSGGVSVRTSRHPVGEDFTVGEKAPMKNQGVAQKCTLCYDRIKVGDRPACAQACPTTSIKFGTRNEMLDVARRRLTELHAQGITEARLYGANEDDGVGGTGSIFLLLDDPEVYGLPPYPEVPTRRLPGLYTSMLKAAVGMAGVFTASFLLGGHK